ncbi:hypothetical protein, partial [Streptomyces sp. C]|uniref:hypothetical protein n=1 Tax=Streptomyces sp. C TaxID=253839 RepID=UPI0019D6EEF0
MDSPKARANTTTGSLYPSPPRVWTPSGPAHQPSWKTRTSAPNEAPRGQGVHHDRLERQEHRAGHRQQQDVAGQGDQGGGAGRVLDDLGPEVGVERGPSGHPDGEVRRPLGPESLHEAGGGGRVLVGHRYEADDGDPRPRRGGGFEPLHLRGVREALRPRREPGRVGAGHDHHGVGPVLGEPVGDQVGEAPGLGARRQLQFADRTGEVDAQEGRGGGQQ